MSDGGDGGDDGGEGSAGSDGSAGSNVSPTAHYTGYVWARNGMSHPAFVTNEGRLLYAAMLPFNAASQLGRGPTLEGFLLARHRLIDHLLTEAIEAGHVSQVIEIAAGLSPRGWTFAKRYAEKIIYLETDLPAVVARKRAILAGLGSLDEHHRVVELNALAAAGSRSVGSVAASLDPTRGTAIITEGLLNYFDRDAVLGMWRRFAAALAGFRDGVYLADLHVQGDGFPKLTWAMTMGLSAFVRSRVHLHFNGVDAATEALLASGFAAATLHQPTAFPEVIGAGANAAARLVSIVEATA
jgi:O-methyltransferase involved in polyketide biosynthesis